MLSSTLPMINSILNESTKASLYFIVSVKLWPVSICKKEKGILPTETKFVTIEDKKSGFKVMFEEGKVNTVMVWGKTIQLL